MKVTIIPAVTETKTVVLEEEKVELVVSKKQANLLKQILGSMSGGFDGAPVRTVSREFADHCNNDDAYKIYDALIDAGI